MLSGNLFVPVLSEMFFRYDGIYKVVSYKPKVGEAGFRVWTFHLRRDDPTPAPWTAEGKKRIEELGLQMVVSYQLTLIFLFPSKILFNGCK